MVRHSAVLRPLFLALLLPVVTTAAEAPVNPQSQVAVSAVDFLPDAGTGMSLDQRVRLNSRWDLGYYLFQLQEFGAAAREFEKIRSILPRDASLLALIGSCYSMSGQWQAGEKALLEAKAQSPDDGDINGLLGQFYLTAGQSLKGAAYLEHSLKVTPDQEDLRARLATLYLDAGQAERARYHLEWLLDSRGEAAAASGFGVPELDAAYARCLLHSGKPGESLAFARFAHQAEPGNARYARLLGLSLMGNNKYAEAARMLSAGRTELQAEALVYLQWGEALFLDRKWEDAEAVWLEGVSRFPASYDLLWRLSEYYLGTARPAKALRVLKFGEDRNPDHPGNRLLEVRLHRKLGRYAAAEKSLFRLKRMACGRMAKEAMWEEAQLDFAAGRFGSCDKALDRVLQAKHRKAEAHMLKARLAMFRGGKSQAQDQMRQAGTEPGDQKRSAWVPNAYSPGSGEAAWVVSPKRE